MGNINLMNSPTTEADMDDVDGAVFVRIPSTKRDVEQNANDPTESNDVSQSNANSHQVRSPPADESTIKPENNVDSDSECINVNTSDSILRDHEDVTDGKSNRDSLSGGNSSSVSHIDKPGDSDDAMQGVRIPFSSLKLQDEEAQPQHGSSSTFQIELNANTNNDTDLHDNDTIFSKTPEVTVRDNVSKSQSMPLLVQETDQTDKMSTAAGLSNMSLPGESDLTTDGHDTGRIDDTNEHTASETTRSRLMKAFLFPTISLIIYFWDIGSDIRLAVNYRESGDINLFWITLSCIVIPHIMMAIVDVSWVWHDRKADTKQTIGRLILGSLTLGRIVRAVTYMQHIYYAKTLPKNVPVAADVEMNGEQTGKSKTREWHKSRGRDEKRDCFMLDFINAFAESAPQLFVQLYLYYAYDLELTLLRVLNLLSSWISIAWTYSAYYRANREALRGVQDVNVVGFVFFFCSVLSTLAARVICTTMFLVYFKIWIGAIVISVHLLFMVLWIFSKEKPKLPGTTTSSFVRYLYYIFFAYVCILGFMNLREGRSKRRMISFYVLIYAENAVMAVLTIWKMNQDGIDNDKIIQFIILPIGCIIHVVLLSNYYLFMHPTTGLCYNCDVRAEQCAGN